MDNRKQRPNEQIVELTELDDRSWGLAERFRSRQALQQRTISAPRRPEEEPGIERAWGGLMRRKSAEQKRHEAWLREQHWNGTEADYARSWGLALEVSGVRDSIQAVNMEEQELRSVHPHSLAAAIGQELILDSAARIRDLNTEANAFFRRKAFRDR